eukprot:11569019-Ditylum_brightwellii.AAC.1
MNTKHEWIKSIAAWKCNEEDGQVLKWHPKARTMIIKCSTNNTRYLYSVTAQVHVMGEDEKQKKVELVRYNTSQFQICDSLAIASQLKVTSNLKNNMITEAQHGRDDAQLVQPKGPSPR